MEGMESEIRRGKDTRICACCERSLPGDIDLCFECLGYRNFKPKVSKPKIGCNTPGCVTKRGMKTMTNPGSNNQAYKCWGCGCEVVVIDKKPEPSGQSEEVTDCYYRCNPHIAGIMRCMHPQRNPEHIPTIYCLGLSHCDLKVSEPEPSGAKGKCLHLHGSYLEGGAKFCNVCAEEV